MFRARLRGVRWRSRSVPLVLHPDFQVEPTEKILILDPDQTADRRYRQVVEEIGRFSAPPISGSVTLPLLRLLQEDAEGSGSTKLGPETTESSIEGQKPAISYLTPRQHRTLCEALTRSYSKKQLQTYVQHRVAGARGIRSRTKPQLAEIIVKKAWNVTTGKPAGLDNFVRSRLVVLLAADRLMLVLKGAHLLQHVAKVGAKIEIRVSDGLEIAKGETKLENGETGLEGSFLALGTGNEPDGPLGPAGAPSENTNSPASLDADSTYILTITGTDSQVTKAERALVLVLDRCHRSTEDFLAIQAMFESRNEDFGAAVAAIGKALGIHFGRIGKNSGMVRDYSAGERKELSFPEESGEKQVSSEYSESLESPEGVFEVVAFDSFQVQRAKRMLLLMLEPSRTKVRYELNGTSQTTGELKEAPETRPQTVSDLVPFSEDDAMPWYARVPYYVSRQLVARQFITEELEKLQLGDEETPSLEYERQLSEAKSSSTHRDLEEESWSLLRDLGILPEFSKDESKVAEKEKASQITEMKDVTAQETLRDLNPANADTQATGGTFMLPTDPQDPHGPSVPDTTANTASFSAGFSDRNYKFLSTFPDSALPVSTVFTVALGNVLFPAPKAAGVFPTCAPEFTSPSRFSTNAAVVTSKLQQLPTASGATLVDDPHTYMAQLRFVPSPFDREDHQLYPPVELWMELNDRSKADVDTLSIVSVEGENEVMVGQPDRLLDMKVCCQCTGNLLDEAPQAHHPEKQTIDELLAETAPRYSRFDSQPGIKTFLENSRLEFGHHTPSISPYLDVQFGDTTVRYLYVGVSHRKQIEFQYGNRLVQWSTVDGGSVGGRTTEVTFVGERPDKEGVQQLVDDCRRFLDECK